MRISLSLVAFATLLLANQSTQAQLVHYSTAWYPPAATEIEVAYIPAYPGYATVLAEQAEILRLENERRILTRATKLDRMRLEYHQLAHRREASRYETTNSRWKENLLELAQAHRLSSLEFNPVTGTINWPMLAESPRYTEHRELIQLIMRRIVFFHLWDDRHHMDELAQACQIFGDQLRRDTAEFNAENGPDILAVQQFLLGVKYSPYLLAQATPPVDHLASRR